MSTDNFRWYHFLSRCWCLIWGHDMFAGVTDNESQKSCDYCRRCELILSSPSWEYGNNRLSFNLGSKIILLRVKLRMLRTKLNNK